MNQFVKLNLKYVYPKSNIDRTVVVPKDWTLAFLHEVIQQCFGWLDYHLHEFVDKKGVHYVFQENEDMKSMAEFQGEKYVEKLDCDVAIKSALKKKGDTLDYTYDFGDDNRVTITHLGNVADMQESDFDSHGPDLIEDAMGFMGTPGIVKILSEGKKNSQYKECVLWLDNAFHKTPSAVLAEPSAREISARVEHLIRLVCVSRI